LADALEQIRQLEDKDKMEKDQDKKGGQLLEYIKQGNYVYELYSILIHSGSAMGGHYYAYIKSFEDGKWYNFNDSDVSEIVEGNVNDEIQNMFGGNATSAYMLQYRQYDPS
jgi:ubiquitin carboxyl-terminal hydrolase 47